MRFSQKVALAIVLPVCLVLSISGTLSVHRNFMRELDAAAQTNGEAQMQQRYELESLLAGAPDEEIGTVLALLQQYQEQEYAQGKSEIWFTVLGENGTVLYTTLPLTVPYNKQQAAAAVGEEQVLYYTEDGGAYQILGTQMQDTARPLWLVNAYNVSDLFAARDRLILQNLFREGGVLLLVGAAALVVARLLTQPLRQLENASRALSQEIWNPVYRSKAGTNWNLWGIPSMQWRRRWKTRCRLCRRKAPGRSGSWRLSAMN